jgi:RNA polymerase sigma factor (TIGR02999 family)
MRRPAIEVSPEIDKSHQITRLLTAPGRSGREVLEDVLPLVYADLRRLAQRLMGAERSNHTLQATALVHEVFVRLAEGKNGQWESRAHFLYTAARLMRRLLVDHARAHGAAKRGGPAEAIPLDEMSPKEEGATPDGAALTDLIALGTALDRLQELDERKCRALELRYFAGLSIEETAEALEVSPATVVLDTRLARAWLVREIRGR